ncbi:MAG TPA: DUF58 domain-containing protein [Rudaea sp.]|nr:DUF58 domain-containing protein [Rudaea sp.]
MNAPAFFATRWSRLLEAAERRLPALTRLKQPEPLPILLHRRRIYVLPTRFGLLFSLVLVVMLLGALNYNNNPAMLLTCLLAAAAYQSVFQGFRAVDRIELAALHAEPCHAGESLRLTMHVTAGARIRHSLRVAIEGVETVFDVAPGADNRVRIDLAAPQRGWRRIGRIRLYSEYPFGLFHVWSWLNPEFAALVYPRPETDAPPLPVAGADADQHAMRRAGDEFGTLRGYHPTDPLRNIAWKASARHDTLLVKEFELRRGRETVLDFAALEGVEREARISRLARWVYMAESAQVRYTLRLPERALGPALGPDHLHACLSALAQLPGGPA